MIFIGFRGPKALKGQMGREQEALRSLEKAFSLTEKGSMSYASIAMSLGTQEAKLGMGDDALRLMTCVIQDLPSYSPAWSNRAAWRRPLPAPHRGSSSSIPS